MKCPSLEQIYDMDLDNLLALKINIEQNKINFNIIPIDEDDYDLYDYSSPNDKESILELVNSEIKERESTKDLLNFFTNLNYENNINTIEAKFLQELNTNKSKNDLINPNLLDKKVIKNIDETKNLYNNGYLSNKDIFYKSKNLNQPVKLTPNEGIKSLLTRTKIDPTQLQYTVSSNKYVDKFWSIDKERKNRKKNQHSEINNSNTNNNANTNTNSTSNITYNSHDSHKNLMKNNIIKPERKNCVISERIIIGAVQIGQVQNKTKKVKKKRKKKNKENEIKKINTLELMRNYKVSDVTQFLKKKTSLKPLNISTAINKKNNTNNNQSNNTEVTPNIKLYDKTLNKKNSLENNNKNLNINNNKEENNKNNFNKQKNINKNEYKNKENNYNKENNKNQNINPIDKNEKENIINNKSNINDNIRDIDIIEHFYFGYDNNNFKEIKYEKINYKKLSNKNNIFYSNNNNFNQNLLKITKIESFDCNNNKPITKNNQNNKDINQDKKKYIGLNTNNSYINNNNNLLINENKEYNIHNNNNNNKTNEINLGALFDKETNDPNIKENINNNDISKKNDDNINIYNDNNIEKYKKVLNDKKEENINEIISNIKDFDENKLYKEKQNETELEKNIIDKNINIKKSQNNFDVSKSININQQLIDKNENDEILKEEENEEYEEEEEEIEEDNNKEKIVKNNDSIIKELINKNSCFSPQNNNRNEHRKYTLNPIKSKNKNINNFNINCNMYKAKNSNNNINSSNDNSNFSHTYEQRNQPLNDVQTKKYVLSSVKPHNNTSIYHFNKNIIKFNSQRPKSTLSKNIIMENHNINIDNITDYSEIYTNFSELFSGYFLSNNYSQQGAFNLNNTIGELYDSFNKLYYYELNQELIRQKDEMYNDIVRAEAGVIINRIKHAQEKLLKEDDINTNVDKYCILKKCLELEKKNYARENYNINNFYYNNDNNNNNNDNKYKKFFRVVLSRPEIYDIVCYTLYKDNSWSELPHGLSLGQCWNLYWSYGPPNIEFSKLFSFQKVNHLINNRIVHRKDLLHKHIMRVRKLNKKCNEIFNIMPLTFLLSKEYVNFVEEFHRIKDTDDYNIWIVKPVGKSRGKGIFLIDNISDVPLNDTFLVQKYLTSPLLLDEGYKFDMRIYCLVTSVNPLEMFLYKDGFARVSNELYSLDISNIKVHLTNAAIQNRQAEKSKNYEKIYGGSKISLDMLRIKLRRQYGIDFDNIIWPQVKDIITKVFICCQNDIPYCPSTFEMFGFDVIIDSNLKCWLLEINSSPSLERSNVLDDEIKLPLVNDIIKIVDPSEVDKSALINVLERVMKIKNNPKNKNVYLYSPKIQLNIDLTNIFKGKIPRKYGEEPKDMGRFEMICPTKETDKLIRMAGGQKYYNNKRQKKQ